MKTTKTKNGNEAPITSADLLKKMAELDKAREELASNLASIKAAEEAAAIEKIRKEREDAIAKILKIAEVATIPALLKWLNPPKRRGRKASTHVASGERKGRVEVTPELEAKAVALLKAGKLAPEVAEATGIARSTVNKLKSKHNLTKKRGTVVQAPAPVPPAETPAQTAAVA